jgi:hypothetical protein
MAATNTGSGLMTIKSDATGSVSVTRIGNGNTIVAAHGSTPIAYTIHGDDDVAYPNQLTPTTTLCPPPTPTSPAPRRAM